jgi:hypothetical protein
LVFHGSPYSGITEFDREENARKEKSGIKEFGTYFSSNKELARAYAEWNELSDEFATNINKDIQKWEDILLNTRNNRDYNIAEENIQRLKQLKKGKAYPIFLSLKDVEVFDAKGGENIEAWNRLEVKADYKWAKNRDAMDFLKEGKFGVEKKQGVIANNIVDAFVQGNEELRNKFIGTAYLVFDGNENQIKSATENIGTFSAENNDIRFSVQPQAPLDVTTNQFMHDANFEMLMEPSENLQDKYDDCN